ncbi:MAG: AbrB/MazE/SpoVT family DNA-binding domain-containing protein [Candidatus Parvarchaeota archaeon]
MSELKDRVLVIDNGRITIPKKLREYLKIKDGSVLEIYAEGNNKLVLEVLVR